MKKAARKDKQGFVGWYGYEYLYEHDRTEPTEEVLSQLREEAKRNSCAWVLVGATGYGQPVGYQYHKGNAHSPESYWLYSDYRIGQGISGRYAARIIDTEAKEDL